MVQYAGGWGWLPIPHHVPIPCADVSQPSPKRDERCCACHLNVAMASLKSGSPQQALESATTACELCPKNPHAWRWKSEAQLGVWGGLSGGESVRPSSNNILLVFEVLGALVHALTPPIYRLPERSTRRTV